MKRTGLDSYQFYVLLHNLSGPLQF